MTHVFTLYDTAYAALAAETVPAMAQFCSEHGYVFHPRAAPIRADKCCGWNKLAWILEHAQPDDTVIWLDADVLVTAPTCRLECPNDGICFSSDNLGLCAGAFISRGQWSLDFYSAVLTLGVPDKWPWEQQVIKHLADSYTSVRSKISLLSQAVIANPEGPFTATPFAVHFWANGWKIEALSAFVREIKLQGWTSDRHRRMGTYR